jgi:hypothetical protein
VVDQKLQVFGVPLHLPDRLGAGVFDAGADALVGDMHQQGQLRLVEALHLSEDLYVMHLLPNGGGRIDGIDPGAHLCFGQLVVFSEVHFLLGFCFGPE